LVIVSSKALYIRNVYVHIVDPALQFPQLYSQSILSTALSPDSKRIATKMQYKNILLALLATGLTSAAPTEEVSDVVERDTKPPVRLSFSNSITEAS